MKFYNKYNKYNTLFYVLKINSFVKCMRVLVHCI